MDEQVIAEAAAEIGEVAPDMAQLDAETEAEQGRPEVPMGQEASSAAEAQPSSAEAEAPRVTEQTREEMRGWKAAAKAARREKEARELHRQTQHQMEQLRHEMRELIELKQRLKADPYAVAEEHGASYDQWTARKLGGEEIHPEVKAIKQQLAELRAERERERQQAEHYQQVRIQQEAMAEYEHEVVQAAKANGWASTQDPEYIVWKVRTMAERHAQKTGEVLDPVEALCYLEKKLGKSRQAPGQATTSPRVEGRPRVPTLTNGVNGGGTSNQMPRDELIASLASQIGEI